MDIKVDEWLAELERVQKAQPKQEGFTTRELSRACGKSEGAMRRIITRLVEHGSVLPVQVVRTSILSGQTRPVTGYKLAPRMRKRGARS